LRPSSINRDFRTPLTVGIVLSLTLAIVADLLLVLVLRIATPWRRAERRGGVDESALRANVAERVPRGAASEFLADRRGV
jgi:osmoprotectant transport system permease protein